MRRSGSEGGGREESPAASAGWGRLPEEEKHTVRRRRSRIGKVVGLATGGVGRRPAAGSYRPPSLSPPYSLYGLFFGFGGADRWTGQQTGAERFGPGRAATVKYFIKFTFFSVI